MTTESQPYVFQVGETYKTRGGGTARVICVDVMGNFPIVALHKVLEHETVVQHLSNGRWSASMENKLDLLPPEPSKPVKVRLWCTIYVDGYVVAGGWLPSIEIPPGIAAQCDWLKNAEIVGSDLDALIALSASRDCNSCARDKIYFTRVKSFV